MIFMRQINDVIDLAILDVIDLGSAVRVRNLVGSRPGRTDYGPLGIETEVSHAHLDNIGVRSRKDKLEKPHDPGGSSGLGRVDILGPRRRDHGSGRTNKPILQSSDRIGILGHVCPAEK
jgi:hypothetical protein